MTTAAKLIECGIGAPAGHASQPRARACRPASAPPKTLASTPITVMPICTVERKRPGSRFSSSATRAPRAAELGGVLQPRLARRDDRHLRQREEAVEQNEQQDDGELQPQHGVPPRAGRLAAMLAAAETPRQRE